jgi:hypothetical protein
VKRLAFAALIVPVVTTACSDIVETNSDKCTLEAIGKGSGADNIHVTLRVPDQLMHGAEISNGGIIALWEDCDFALNAFISAETADYIIYNTPKRTLTDREHQFRLVDASLFVWKFSDGSGEPRFFVMRVQEMTPITSARTADERDHFTLPATT